MMQMDSAQLITWNDLDDLKRRGFFSLSLNRRLRPLYSTYITFSGRRMFYTVQYISKHNLHCEYYTAKHNVNHQVIFAYLYKEQDI
jgi:hypothetical protein